MMPWEKQRPRTISQPSDYMRAGQGQGQSAAVPQMPTMPQQPGMGQGMGQATTGMGRTNAGTVPQDFRSQLATALGNMQRSETGTLPAQRNPLQMNKPTEPTKMEPYTQGIPKDSGMMRPAVQPPQANGSWGMPQTGNNPSSNMLPVSGGNPVNPWAAGANATALPQGGMPQNGGINPGNMFGNRQSFGQPAWQQQQMPMSSQGAKYAGGTPYVNERTGAMAQPQPRNMQEALMTLLSRNSSPVGQTPTNDQAMLQQKMMRQPMNPRWY